MTTLGPFTLVVVETPTLGDRSYLVHDGEAALVVDPQRDIDRMEALLDQHELRLAAVFETHLHNDYLTGGLALAERRGAAYLVNADDEVRFARTPVRDGDTIPVGARMRMTALATPGHTFTHLSYALTDAGADRLGDALAVFSGGSLLFGATGRPDLLGADHTEELTRRQHRSAQRLAALLPDEAELLPTHGFGSFCSATQAVDVSESTIGRERRENPALRQSEREYVDAIVGGLDAWPAYYVHMAPANAAGPSAPDLSLPERADAAELRRRLEAGEWLVDLRHRTAFAAGHVAGSYNIGIDGSFATYLGWLVEPGTSITLLGESADQVAEAQRELARISLHRAAAHASGRVEDWTDDPRSYPIGSFEELARVRAHRPVTVLDVRLAREHAEGRVTGALHIPLHQLTARSGELPEGEVWVHCASGYRASIAASLLAAAGHCVVAVDDALENAPAGLVEPGPPA